MTTLSSLAAQISGTPAPASQAAADALNSTPSRSKAGGEKASAAPVSAPAGKVIPIKTDDTGADTGIPVFLRRKPGEKIPYAGKEPKAAAHPKPTTAAAILALPKKHEAPMTTKTTKTETKPPKKAKAPVAPKMKAKAKAANGNGKSKTAIVAAMLLRKGGCTNKEILAATKWPSVSVPQQAKANGLKIRKEKVKGEPTRYFGAQA